MGLKIHATYDIFNLYIIISMFIMCATKYFIMTEKMDFYGIRDIMNETLNEKKTFVPRHGDKESLDDITAKLNEAKMHPCVFLNNHAIGIEAAGDFMKLLNSGEEQYSDNDMVDKDLLKNVYNTLKKIYKDEGKKLKESTMFESVLNENGIEVYPEDGKLKARNIGQQVVSSRTQNKLNPLGTKDVAKPLTPTQKAATSAVLNILNDKGKAGDINSEFDTNPRPDITLMANGDAVITPDGQKNRSYKIPASEIDAHMRESASKLLENRKLNEKRIEIPNPYPVKKEEIIDLVERSSRLVHTATDDKTIQLYIYSNGSERPEAFAEVEITSAGYILHGAEGYDYQGNSMKEFENDLRDVVFNFDAITSRRFGESVKKNTMKESDALNESNVVIAQWRRDTAERLIKEANKIDSSYSFVEYDIGPKKEIKYKVFKNDDEYVGTFDVFTDEPYNSPYRFFFNHVNLPNVEFQGMDIDEFDKMFKDFITTDKRLGHKH